MPRKELEEKEEKLKEFLIALKEASRNIDEYYFKVAMANLKGYRFRERVYCYELYHQLRLALPTTFSYTLQGEMDKNGHPIIHKEVGAVKPDFILHKQEPEDNLLVIEVKPLNNTNKSQIKKDLDTLTKFLDLDMSYYRAIHLIYGSLKRKDGGISKVIKTYQEYHRNTNQLSKYKNKLLLFWHKSVRQSAEKYNWEKDVK